ncbi:hypothetical protein MD537_19020, partial [Flavihumibacter sediminis]|nr:hypothetical protein [Flavihumibacter sediminis]
FVARLDALKETAVNREKRIAALTSTAGQFEYLHRFLSVMDKRCVNMRWSSAADKLRFYAAAYNAGFHRSTEDIKILAGRERFKLSEWSKRSYSYSELALTFYQQELQAGN